MATHRDPRRKGARWIATAIVLGVAVLAANCGDLADPEDTSTTEAAREVGDTTVPVGESLTTTTTTTLVPVDGPENDFDELFTVGGNPAIYLVASQGFVHDAATDEIVGEVDALDLNLQVVAVPGQDDLYAYRWSSPVQDTTPLGDAVDLTHFDGTETQRCSEFTIDGASGPPLFVDPSDLPVRQAPLTMFGTLPAGEDNVTFTWYDVNPEDGTYTTYLFPVIIDEIQVSPFSDASLDISELLDAQDGSVDGVRAECDIVAIFDGTEVVFP
jgi:hypothetical protein